MRSFESESGQPVRRVANRFQGDESEGTPGRADGEPAAPDRSELGEGRAGGAVAGIHVSRHAIERYCERGAGAVGLADATQSLLRLLEIAEPIGELSTRLARRLRRHPRGAVFLQAGRWVLVVSDGVLVTVEHVGMPAWRGQPERREPTPKLLRPRKRRRRTLERVAVRRAHEQAAVGLTEWERAR